MHQCIAMMRDVSGRLVVSKYEWHNELASSSFKSKACRGIRECKMNKNKERIILSVNAWSVGSTGKLMIQLSEAARSHGYISYVACSSSKSNLMQTSLNWMRIGNRLERNLHRLLAFVTGFSGLFSLVATFRFINQVKKLNPDIIHLHNLHNCYINLPMLFTFLRRSKIAVVWTLHDCWSFTGHCPYFSFVQCNKWQSQCYDCPQYHKYPGTMFDNSKKMFHLKKKWFSGLPNLVLVTPSNWLMSLAKQSFLGNYPITVIHNGIDTSVFKPTESNFRADKELEDKFIVLGVAFGWSTRKGLDMFVEIAKRLDSSYQVVLVGTTSAIDRNLPPNIISIHRTTNQQELASLYTVSDVFVNPTREEVFGLVNIESIACGTPVITFNTGGCPECVNENEGIIVESNTVEELVSAIESVRNGSKAFELQPITQSSYFSIHRMNNEYVRLYDQLVSLSL